MWLQREKHRPLHPHLNGELRPRHRGRNRSRGLSHSAGRRQAASWCARRRKAVAGLGELSGNRFPLPVVHCGMRSQDFSSRYLLYFLRRVSGACAVIGGSDQNIATF